MNKCKLERINQLARKSRESGLTKEESEEQQRLRREYIDSCKQSLSQQLENIYFIKNNEHYSSSESKH